MKQSTFVCLASSYTVLKICCQTPASLTYPRCTKIAQNEAKIRWGPELLSSSCAVAIQAKCPYQERRSTILNPGFVGLVYSCPVPGLPNGTSRRRRTKPRTSDGSFVQGLSNAAQLNLFLEIHVKIRVALHRCDQNSFQIFTSDMARWLGSCWNPLKNLKYRFVKVLVNAVLVFGMRHSMLSLGSGVACDFRHVVSAKKMLQHQGRHQNLKPYSPILRMPSNKLHPDPNDLVPGFFVWQPGRLGKSAKRFAANIGDGAMGRAYCEHVLNLFLWRPENARPFLTPGYCGSWAHFIFMGTAFWWLWTIYFSIEKLP